ncbi:MAG TPA: tetratricopeptide repeat protein [Candidatus Acidoferrum sp.]|jgi:tetratricopeptide (TPR) repeat protein
MAYNKSKHVEIAQKLLNQGKVAQAIAEYQQILKYEPRDQVTLMTIGELYIRQGETFQAIDYFERLAQLFVGDGFLTKAIAVYKRIAKLAPEEIRPLEKLADLYVQQGVMSEARPLFLQLAEIHLKSNRQPEAVSLLRKLLLAEPDNLRIQVRLADLYVAMGQNNEAAETYVSAAQRALARGDQAECEKLAEKALKISPSNLSAVIVKARVYTTQGNFAQASHTLEHVPDLEKGGEQTELLLDLYLKNAKWDQATALADRVFEADNKNFGPTQKVVESMLESGQGDRAMTILERIRIPMIDAGEHEAIGKLLNELATRLAGRIEPLEWLVDTYGRTSDSFRLPDALANLGDALVAAKNYDRAKQTFEQLVDREPESDSAKRKLNDVLRKMGLLPPEESAAPIDEDAQPAELARPSGPKVRPDLEPPTAAEQKIVFAASEPTLDEDTQKFIAQSLTDVDLFASYGLTQKAIGLLEAILRRAPKHTPTLEKLLDFVLGAGDDRRTAELAAQLEHLHQERGDARSAERFGELRRRFQRAAGLTDEELASTTETSAVDEMSVPEVAAEAAVPETPSRKAVAPSEKVSASQPSAHDAVHEVDLSDEWASMLEDTRPHEPAAAQPPSATPEFEIQEEEAPAPDSQQAHEPAAASTRSHDAAPELAEFEISVDTPEPEPAAFEEISEEIPQAAEPAGESLQVPSVDAEASPIFEPPAPQAEIPAKHEPAAEAPHAPSKTPEPEFELEQDYELILDPEPLVPAYDQKPPEPHPIGQNAAPSTGGGMASDQFLSDLANELGADELTPAFSQASSSTEAPTHRAKPIGSGETGPLKEVFDDFRAELGEMGLEDEDLETHYNLGIAFREMGLLEEAISEFQKVAKATEQGRAFRYTMQCCTLLGLAFTDKGQPAIAAIWYERALRTPGLDAESLLALRYDLGIALESAGDAAAALKSFYQVYAMNIDYRDVADRIAALQKPTH